MKNLITLIMLSFGLFSSPLILDIKLAYRLETIDP